MIPTVLTAWPPICGKPRASGDDPKSFTYMDEDLV